MQPPHRDAVLNRTFAQPDIHQLPPPNNPVLPLREPRHLRFNPPSPSQPTYIGG